MEMSLKDEFKRAHLFENAEQFPAMCLPALYSSRCRRDSGPAPPLVGTACLPVGRGQANRGGVLYPIRKPRWLQRG
jgi:hypothetical protein